MALTISAQQRDALYDQIHDRLSGIGDIWIAVCAENYDVAQRLGREYSDELRLVTEDLGWGEATSEAVELSAPPDVLRRTLGRLRDAALSNDSGERKLREEVRQAAERNRLVVEACERVLADLDGDQGGA